MLCLALGTWGPTDLSGCPDQAHTVKESHNSIKSLPSSFSKLVRVLYFLFFFPQKYNLVAFICPA